jgi:hypothetical protein
MNIITNSCCGEDALTPAWQESIKFSLEVNLQIIS